MESNQGADIRRQLLGNAVAAAAASTALANSHDRRRMQPGGFPYGNPNFYQYYWYGDYPFPPEDKFIGIIPWALKIMKLFAIGFMLLTSSIAMYALFYWAVMPGNYASRPLFFDYTGTVVYPHMEAMIETHVDDISDHTAIELDNKKWWKKKWKKDKGTEIALSTSTAFSSSSESRCAFTPWATVDLFSEEQAVTLGETMNSELVPPPTISDRVLQPQQRYYVEVHLRLPESELNRQLGMFGVAVELLSYSSANSTSAFLASSVRPARLPHESAWIGVARKLVWLLPLIFGGMEESRTVVVPSFRHIVESKDHPLRHIVVRLVGQPSGWNGQTFTREESLKFPVEVIGGEVRIGKELNEFQQMLKDWFYTCYAIGTLILFGVHAGVYVLVDYYRRDSLDDFGEPYVDPSYDFDNPAGYDENDEFESIISEPQPHTDGGGDDGDSDDDDNNDAGNQFNDAAPNVDTYSGFSGPAPRDSGRDYYDDADDPDDWEDLTFSPSPQANERHNLGGQEEEEATDVTASNDSPQVVPPILNRDHIPISSVTVSDHVYLQQPTSTATDRGKSPTLSAPIRQNRGISGTRNQLDKLDAKRPFSLFTVGTMKFSTGKFASKSKETLLKNNAKYDQSSFDACTRSSRTASVTEVESKNCVVGAAEAQKESENLSKVEGTAEVQNESENHSNEEFIEPLPEERHSRHYPFREPDLSEESCTLEFDTGMASPRSITFPSAIPRVQNAKAWKRDTSLVDGYQVHRVVTDADFDSIESRKDAIGSSDPQNGEKAERDPLSARSFGHTEVKLKPSTLEANDGSAALTTSMSMSIDRKAAVPLTLPDPHEIQEDALLIETPLAQTRGSTFDEDDSVASTGSWESLSAATEKARTTNMKWVSIDSDDISSFEMQSSPTTERAPLSLQIASSPIGSQIAYKATGGNSGSIVHHEADHNLLHEMSELHEAQLVDSFLRDLISPFIR